MRGEWVDKRRQAYPKLAAHIGFMECRWIPSKPKEIASPESGAIYRGWREVMTQPPHSIESEIGALSCQIEDPSNCIPQFMSRFKDEHLAHYDIRHQIVQRALIDMSAGGEPVNLLGIVQRLKKQDDLDRIGGIEYLNQIQDASPSPANMPFYLKTLEDEMMLRKMLEVCNHAKLKILGRDGDAHSIIDAVEQQILSVRPTQSNFKPIQSLLWDAIGIIETRASNWDTITGHSTGLKDLDRLTDGIHAGELIVIGAPTSCGKTALALNIIAHNALSGVPSGFLSAEMTGVRLALRALCSESRVNYRRVTEPDCQKLTPNVSKIGKSPLYIDSVNGMSVNQVRAIARRWKQQFGIKIIAVENIQLLSGNGKNREQEIADISRGLKGMALELDIAVLGLSQLNDDGKLRESRAIGHDADSAWILSNDGEWQPHVQPVKLNIEKCRDGETGCVNLTFFKEYTRFECAAKEL